MTLLKISIQYFLKPYTKPMLLTRLLQLIDKNLDFFKDWGCDFNCLNQPWCCKNKDPVSRYVCYKLYS